MTAILSRPQCVKWVDNEYSSILCCDMYSNAAKSELVLFDGFSLNLYI